MNQKEFKERLKELYGWYAAISVEEVCRINVLSLIHGCGRIVYNTTDEKEYMPLEFVGNRMDGENLREIKAVDLAQWEMLCRENENEADEIIRFDVPEELCVWLNVWELYDSCQMELALKGEMLGSQYRKYRSEIFSVASADLE